MPQSKKSDEQNDLRVSVSEAAKMFGVDQITIRRAIKEKDLRYIVVRNRYRISFASLLRWSQGRTSVRNKLAKKGLGQFVDKWKISNTLYSPRPGRDTDK
jgi:excisionase family DNA binding protein